MYHVKHRVFNIFLFLENKIPHPSAVAEWMGGVQLDTRERVGRNPDTYAINERMVQARWLRFRNNLTVIRKKNKSFTSQFMDELPCGIVENNSVKDFGKHPWANLHCPENVAEPKDVQSRHCWIRHFLVGKRNGYGIHRVLSLLPHL